MVKSASKDGKDLTITFVPDSYMADLARSIQSSMVGASLRFGEELPPLTRKQRVRLWIGNTWYSARERAARLILPDAPWDRGDW